MPKGDYKILKADPEDGTTPIANLLLEALALADLNGREKSAVLFLWRVTYGWVGNGGKRLKAREISLQAWSRVLRTDEYQASKIITSLINQRVITRTFNGPGQGYIYAMNTRISEWACINLQELSEIPTLSLTKIENAGKRKGLSKDARALSSEASSERVVLSKNTTPPLSDVTTLSNTGVASPKSNLKSNKNDGSDITKSSSFLGEEELLRGEPQSTEGVDPTERKAARASTVAPEVGNVASGKVTNEKVALILTRYERSFGKIVPTIAEELREFCHEYTADWVLEAVDRACAAQAKSQINRPIRYLTSILEKFRVDGGPSASVPPRRGKRSQPAPESILEGLEE